MNREGRDKLLEQAYEQFQFSTRAYHKILKTARTIADMESSEKIKEEHICEALAYRHMTRNTGHKTEKRKVFLYGRNTANKDPVCPEGQ